jgi:hypothetical protein
MKVRIMSQPHKVNRKAALIAAGVSAALSIALFIFQPIPPVGLVAAIELAVLPVIWLYQAFFPGHAERMRQRLEPMMKAKDDPNEPARWVP